MAFCVRGIQRHLVVMPQIATNLISPPLLTAPFFFAELMIALGSAFPVRAPDLQSCGELKGTNFERIKERTKNNTEKHKLFSLKSNFHVSIFIILSLLLFLFFLPFPPKFVFLHFFRHSALLCKRGASDCFKISFETTVQWICLSWCQQGAPQMGSQ